MLIELRIQNLVVIQDLSLTLGEGLNALTGETGAGKSIIVGALSLLLGERASTESVRSGADRAVVEAVFDLASRPDLQHRLADLGFPSEEGLLLLRRVVQAEGRNRAWINGSPATAGVVGEFGRALVDLHGQHEHQALLGSAEQRRILDAYGKHEDLAERVAALHRRTVTLESDLADRQGRRRELEARADFLRFQLREIEEAEVKPDEDGQAEEELGRLDHAEELVRDSETVHRMLYAESGSVSERLSEAMTLMDRLTRFDPDLASMREEVEGLYHQAVELGRSAGSYASGIEVAPGRAEALRKRVDLLFRLKRKYGPDLEDVLATRDAVRTELDELEGSEVELDETRKLLRATQEELRGAAGVLTERRREAGEKLARAVQEILPELGMPGARFAIDLAAVDEPESGGAERVHFLASLNRGFELRPLARIASGGELSRVMLALKSILAADDRVPTLVFDEIDAGIGGTVAVAIARKLREVSEHHQVFIITHLAQLASRGHQHLRVEKGEREGVALTTVHPLEGEGRIREIARMLGGDPDSSASRDHARELLAVG